MNSGASKQRAGSDSHIVENAIRLAIDIGERGLQALTEFMERDRPDFGRTPPRRDLESPTSPVTDGTNKERVDRQQALQDAERAAIDFVRAVAPPTSLAAARIVTGIADLPDRGWHANTVAALREVARVATSLINDSVGSGGGAPATEGPLDIVPIAIDEGGTSVPIDLINEEWSAREDVVHEIEIRLVVTPVVGNGHVVAVIQPGPVPLPVGAERESIELELAEPLHAGTYWGSIYAICEDVVVASAGLKVTAGGDQPTRQTAAP